MTAVRRARAVAVAGLAVAALVASGCGPTGGVVGRGRRDSWVRIAEPSFTADASYSVSGLASPGDGYGRWTAAGGRWTAAGSVDDPSAGGTRAVAWTSADGSRWSRLDLDATGARASEATAAARRQGRSVVVGSVITQAGDRDGRIWTSTDGLTWARVDDATGVLGGPGDQELTAVAGGPLGFVAAGVDRTGERAVPAVWWSADGTAWRRVGVGDADPTFTEGTAIEGVAVGRAGVVAVGTLATSGDVDGMAWFSADGTSWRTVPLGAAGFAGRATQAVHGVTATDGGFVAVGDDAGGDRRVAVAWTSADGITWQRQPPSPDMAELSGLADTAGARPRRSPAPVPSWPSVAATPCSSGRRPTGGAGRGTRRPSACNSSPSLPWWRRTVRLSWSARPTGACGSGARVRRGPAPAPTRGPFPDRLIRSR